MDHGSKRMSYRRLDAAEFDETITLRDAYRIMGRFVSDYLARGDTPVSDFLHVYAGETLGDQTADPAAIEDFLAAARRVLSQPKSPRSKIC
jgi:hypothetical protein